MKFNRIIIFFTLTFLFFSCKKEVELSGSEETQIEKYVSDNKLTVTEKTASGLRYIRTAPSVGALVKKGQSLNVNYLGKFLTNKKFDGGNFNFTLGGGRVIAGFDEGIAKMKVGEKAILIFPSAIGYGATGSGSIPGNSPLVFEIEVVSAR